MKHWILGFIVTLFFTVSGGAQDTTQTAQAVYDEGIQLYYNENFRQAYETFSQVIALDPNFLAGYAYRGMALRALGRHAEAMQDYSTLFAIDPNFALGYAMRARLYYDMGETELAWADIDRALELSPDSPDVYVSRARLYYLGNDYFGAVQDYNRAIELSEDPLPFYYLQRGLSYINMGNYNAAMENYEYVVATWPESGWGYYYKGTALGRVGQYEDAQAQMEMALQLMTKPEDIAQVYERMGYYYMERGQADKALENLNLAIEFDPEHSNAYVNRGALYYFTGDLEAAYADMDVAVQHDANNAEALVSRGYLSIFYGDAQQGLINLNRAIELRPDFAQAYINRAEVNAYLGNYQAAITDYTLVLDQQQPQSANLLNLRGLAYMGLGEYQRAAADFQDASLYDPNSVDYVINHANAMKAQEDYEFAYFILTDAIAKHPVEGCLYQARAEINRQRGAASEADSDLALAAQYGCASN